MDWVWCLTSLTKHLGCRGRRISVSSRPVSKPCFKNKTNNAEKERKWSWPSSQQGRSVCTAVQLCTRVDHGRDSHCPPLDTCVWLSQAPPQVCVCVGHMCAFTYMQQTLPHCADPCVALAALDLLCRPGTAHQDIFGGMLAASVVTHTQCGCKQKRSGGTSPSRLAGEG